jgi:two-component system sensor histidine kinase EvgS
MVKAQVLITCCETLESVCEQHDGVALGAAVEAIDVAIEQLHHSIRRYGNQA